MEAPMTVLSDRVAEDRVLVSFDDTFDTAQALRLSEILSEVSAGTRVMLDFTQVREFHDVAFAKLAQELREARGPDSQIEVSARGLCQHQLRILKYLGFTGEGLQGWAEEEDIDSDFGAPDQTPWGLF
jgi:hypothetical protein